MARLKSKEIFGGLKERKKERREETTTQCDTIR